MDNINGINESQYKVDFDISKGYIDFSSELLRLSLLAMGGFGSLVLIKLKDGGKDHLPASLNEPSLFLISMACSGCVPDVRFSIASLLQIA